MADNFTFNPDGHKYELNGKKVTGVTTILGVIAKPALIGWAANMAVDEVKKEGMPLREWLEKIETSPKTEIHTDKIPSDYIIVGDEILADARKAHTKKKEAAGDVGTLAHALIENFIKCVHVEQTTHDEYVRREQEITDKLTKEEYEKVKPMVNKFAEWTVNNNIVFLDSEKSVFHKDLFYAGTFDFSFEKDGKRYIGDLKTMKKMFDRVPFFQTAAYMMASEHMGEEKYDGSCIVNISKETNELTDHWTYDHEKDKEAFLAALTLYRQLNQF